MHARMETVTVNIRGVGEKRIGVNSIALEEKNLAVQMLYQYCNDMGTALIAPTNFIEPIAQALIPMLKFRLYYSYHDHDHHHHNPLLL